ncbi:MAG: polysaccharide deacetylase family protein [Acidimicrobiia bacterium]
MSNARELVRKARGIPGAALTRVGRRLPTKGLGAAVLCYHDVGVDPANHTDYYIAPDRFRDHLEWITSWGLTIVPLAEIVDRLVAGRSLDGLVAITFDDALVGLHGHVAPILEAMRVPATVFVVSDVLGVDPPFWPGASRTLTVPELRELAATGLVTIGSHTCSHVSLPDVTPDVRTRELADSRARLAAIVDTTADLLAYPSGHHDTDVERAAAAAGYRAAFTFSFGRAVSATDPFAIPRFCIGPDHDAFRLARQLARPPAAWS